jgi:tetratricopeptide (TPR) repeat protein
MSAADSSTNDGAGGSSSSSKLFFTTSDLLSRINETLAGMDDPEVPLNPRFELQRRLPDGSTRKATPADQQVADLESKIKQAADEVKDFSNIDKIQWAALQRNEGNILYKKGAYQEALDVYLTCLVVKTDSNEFTREVFLPCLNNLAQCTLKLGMYLKTETYCSIALDELAKSTVNDDDDDDGPLVAKLYFRRGKARRLGGKYDLATIDLQKALTMVQDPKPIHHELQLVKRAMLEAQRNKKRQERAMQQVWASHSNNNDDDDDDEPSLYDDALQKRSYSKLRAKQYEDDSGNDTTETATLSYWDYYLALIGRIAERFLILTGDDETIRRINLEKED